ncbi:hypothetical protein PAEVO_04160 [Paenibacillus sp. GM2FR]|nr:hypothetical protein PAEVO_04160 [Paenibacillus sp. GM2FR]
MLKQPWQTGHDPCLPSYCLRGLLFYLVFALISF